MIPQSGFDLKVIVNELKELESGRIEKFYNTKEGELLIKIYHKRYGKVVLRALRGEAIHLTNFQRRITEHPSGFTMLMRKYMKGAVIKSIEQPFFERIIIIKLEKTGNLYFLIIELFNKGNIVVCDGHKNIINSLRFVKVKDRIIRPRERYELPVPRFKDVFLDKIEFKRLIKGSDKDSIVKTLAIDLGMGGKYAEELLALAELDKNKEPGMLKQDELKKLYEVFFLMYKSVKHYKNMKPCIMLKNGVVINFAPFPFKSFEDCEFKFFDTFNEACDYYYSNTQKEAVESEALEVFNNRISQLENRLEQQEKNLEYLEAESERLAKLGEIVFSNYDLINTILDRIRVANKNNIGWDEIKRMIENEKAQGSVEANSIKCVNEKEGTITFIINGEEFTSKLSSTANEIAQEFFERSKKLRGKISGAGRSVKTTKEEIKRVESEGVEAEEW